MLLYEGNIDYIEGVTFDRKYVEFKPFVDKDYGHYWVEDKHTWWVELTNDYNLVRCYLTEGTRI